MVRNGEADMVSWRIACLLVVLTLGAGRLASQTPTESQFITSVSAAIQPLLNLPAGQRIVLSGNLVYANGGLIATIPQPVLLAYVDGLKAAGVERVDLNPGVTSINNPSVVALYDAVVHHIRELGLQLSMNPAVGIGEVRGFQDFENTAISTYPQLAARYQPDNFVIVHEPTTMDARMRGRQRPLWRTGTVSFVP